jgi:predicted nucleic acid-binding protein
MIVVDTSVWIDYFNERTTVATRSLEDFIGREEILVGDLILAEVLQGLRTESDFQRVLGVLENLEFQDMVGRDIAVASARNYRFLRSRGITVRKTIDVMIGTFCILNDHTLLHSDRDFDVMAEHLGLKILRAQ